MRVAVLMLLALFAFGCTDDFSADGGFIESDMSGSVKIPLTATDADGNTYRLRAATFEISGAAMVTLSERDAKKDADSLVTPLPPGTYSLYLRPGFEVVSVSNDGALSAVAATMASKNPVNFTVHQMSDESLKLEFKNGDASLVFGAGPVRVTSADALGSEQAL